MRNKIVYWLETQKKAIVDNPDEREALNSALLNHCYIYPDKIVIRLNYQDPKAQDELSANQNENPETKKATFEVKDGTFRQDVVRLSSDWHRTTKRIQSTRKYCLGAFGCKMKNQVQF